MHAYIYIIKGFWYYSGIFYTKTPVPDKISIFIADSALVSYISVWLGFISGSNIIMMFLEITISTGYATSKKDVLPIILAHR